MILARSELRPPGGPEPSGGGLGRTEPRLIEKPAVGHNPYFVTLGGLPSEVQVHRF